MKYQKTLTLWKELSHPSSEPSSQFFKDPQIIANLSQFL